jgi:hypothetical protein
MTHIDIEQHNPPSPRPASQGWPAQNANRA